MALAMPSFSGHSVTIPAEESSVLVGNQLSFKLFDHIKSWVVESFSESSPSTFILCSAHPQVESTQSPPFLRLWNQTHAK